jgi:hypothetical protein
MMSTTSSIIDLISHINFVKMVDCVEKTSPFVRKKRGIKPGTIEENFPKFIITRFRDIPVSIDDRQQLSAGCILLY